MLLTLFMIPSIGSHYVKLKKILIYNSGGGLGDSIQIIDLILSLQNYYKDCELFYLGAHKNHFDGKLKEFNIKIQTLDLKLNILVSDGGIIFWLKEIFK